MMAAAHPPVAYKIVAAEEWRAALAEGRYDGSAVDRADGYIHMSTEAQLAETARKHYAGRSGLRLLTVELAVTGGALKWEASRGGALFPHLYRDLRLSDVLWHRPIPLGPQGHEPGELA